VTKGLCGGGTPCTSPAGTGERRLEEGHSTAVPLHGTAVPLLANGACALGNHQMISPQLNEAWGLCYNLRAKNHSGL
jgi:hypothetical protein